MSYEEYTKKAFELLVLGERLKRVNKTLLCLADLKGHATTAATYNRTSALIQRHLETGDKINDRMMVLLKELETFREEMGD